MQSSLHRQRDIARVWPQKLSSAVLVAAAAVSLAIAPPAGARGAYLHAPLDPFPLQTQADDVLKGLAFKEFKIFSHQHDL